MNIAAAAVASVALSVFFEIDINMTPFVFVIIPRDPAPRRTPYITHINI